MHLVPAPAVRLMKRRVLSRPGVNSLLAHCLSLLLFVFLSSRLVYHFPFLKEPHCRDYLRNSSAAQSIKFSLKFLYYFLHAAHLFSEYFQLWAVLISKIIIYWRQETNKKNENKEGANENKEPCAAIKERQRKNDWSWPQKKSEDIMPGSQQISQS